MLLMGIVDIILGAYYVFRMNSISALMMLLGDKGNALYTCWMICGFCCVLAGIFQIIYSQKEKYAGAFIGLCIAAAALGVVYWKTDLKIAVFVNLIALIVAANHEPKNAQPPEPEQPAEETVEEIAVEAVEEKDEEQEDKRQ